MLKVLGYSLSTDLPNFRVVSLQQPEFLEVSYAKGMKSKLCFKDLMSIELHWHFQVLFRVSTKFQYDICTLDKVT